MITIDTWVVVSKSNKIVTLECPFMDNGTVTISEEEVGDCTVGDILSTESGGWDYLKYEELNDLNDEGRQIFYDYINKKGFHYSGKSLFIADK